MIPKTVSKNFLKKQQYCIICGKPLGLIDLANLGWSMKKPGVYSFWHKKCYGGFNKNA